MFPVHQSVDNNEQNNQKINRKRTTTTESSLLSGLTTSVVTQSKVIKMNPELSKTSISYLQEICQKEVSKAMPIYTDLSENSTNSNIKIFRIKCEACGYSAIGEGTSKKIAKHSAAEKVLKKYFNKNSSCSSDDEEVDGVLNDGVSTLLDFCSRRNFPKPEYIEIKQVGPSHAPEFTIECKVSSVKKIATDNNKKQAKHKAAFLMLKVLSEGYQESLSNKSVALYGSKQDDIEELKYKVSTYLDLKKRNKVSDLGRTINERQDFFSKLEPEIYAPLSNIIYSSSPHDEEKYLKFVEELKTIFKVQISQFVDSDLEKFEVLIPENVFTCVIIDKKENLWMEVLNYFSDMMKTNKSVEPN